MYCAPISAHTPCSGCRLMGGEPNWVIRLEHTVISLCGVFTCDAGSASARLRTLAFRARTRGQLDGPHAPSQFKALFVACDVRLTFQAFTRNSLNRITAIGFAGALVLTQYMPSSHVQLSCSLFCSSNGADTLSPCRHSIANLAQNINAHCFRKPLRASSSRV